MSMAGLTVPYVDADLEARVRAGLEDVERQLVTAVASRFDFVTETARHLIDAGGKRFRPLLVLLAAEFGDPTAPGIVQVAVIVELTHLATLHHDDVMDEAVLRRGAPSANARWNNTIAILTGDYLFAKASDRMVELGLEAVRIQAQTFSRLVEGQIRETLGPSEGEDPLEHYLAVLADKTGSLIATSARLGAKLAGASPEVEKVVTEFGEKIGVAFQLSDDVLDIASDASQSGKMPGTDLREGVATLPVLLARQSKDPADERLRTLLSGPITNDDDHAEALALLRAHPAMEQAQAIVRQWADDARQTLSMLPDIPARDALDALCDIVVSRTG
ncbi:polyprenyl synthetase family protein [Thermasporomyces composti]|jgi:heptaprenyl diphosphate synthase|uniref:Heptaprenyl diphosphate synthase n=1 Tax=Thermasporomyces composti TaxID=696763 RepID=A0A3D9V5T5_THECX|nr:polyprenyl synthetase family protein [Thermasporomyces composti]REF37128.1 heptaprenyl diphosphate synthase [Thermasporomyces composti]